MGSQGEEALAEALSAGIFTFYFYFLFFILGGLGGKKKKIES
jgi:hypothetical protein